MTQQQFAQIEKPSELLRLAINDLRVVEKLPKYVVNMETWHLPEDSTDPNSICYVCLAGAVMANSFGLSPSEDVSPYSFDGKTQERLCAINRLRAGDVEGALSYLDLDPNVGIGFNRHIPEYEQHGFYQAIDKLTCDLEDAGL